MIKIAMVVLYSIFAFFAWFSFVFWLHDEKAELKYSWILSIIFGVALATVWPLSLIGIYFNTTVNDAYESSEEN